MTRRDRPSPDKGYASLGSFLLDGHHDLQASTTLTYGEDRSVIVQLSDWLRSAAAALRQQADEMIQMASQIDASRARMSESGQSGAKKRWGNIGSLLGPYDSSNRKPDETGVFLEVENRVPIGTPFLPPPPLSLPLGSPPIPPLPDPPLSPPLLQSCLPIAASGSSGPTDAAVMAFPVNGNGGRVWEWRQTHLAHVQEAFPHLDVLGEARKAKLWLESSAGRLKTCRGMPVFLYRWMERAANSGKGMKRTTPYVVGRKPEPPSLDELTEAYLKGELNGS